MARPDGRLEAGQPLRGTISARAWNRAQDAADVVLGSHAGTSGGPQNYPVARNFVHVKLSQAFSPLDFVAIVNSGDPPVSLELPQFNSQIVIGNAVPIGGTSTPPWSTEKCGMLLQGGSANAIVPIQLSGPVYARVVMHHQFHNYARFLSSPSGGVFFESHVCGPVRIAWWDNRTYSNAVAYGTSGSVADAVVVL